MTVGADVGLRALGAALAGLSISFAAYMVAFGGHRVRVNGMEHLAIFAQPRGPASVTPPEPPIVLPSLDMTATGSFTPPADLGLKPRPAEGVAARADRAWLIVDGMIRVVSPGDDLPHLGHVTKITPRDGGWALLDEKGGRSSSYRSRRTRRPCSPKG